MKDYDNRSDKIKYVPKDWTTSPLDLMGSSDNLDSLSLREDLLRIQIHFIKHLKNLIAKRYCNKSMLRIDVATSNPVDQEVNQFAGLYSDREDLKNLLEHSQISLIFKFST